jgi:hypothetical protein
MADGAGARRQQQEDIQRDVEDLQRKLVGHALTTLDDIVDGGEGEANPNRTTHLVERTNGLATGANAFMGRHGQQPSRRPPPTEIERQAARQNPRWIEDRKAAWCMSCERVEFWWRGPPSWTRHHCRSCGWVVCLNCCPADQAVELASWVSSTTGHPIKTGSPAKAKRVCNSCRSSHSSEP